MLVLMVLLSVPPMALQGNRERYYETTNSLLDFVLSNREGIPISLAVLYEAVSERQAGLARCLSLRPASRPDAASASTA